MKKKPKPAKAAAKPAAGTGGAGPAPPPAKKPPPKPVPGTGGGGAAPAPRPKPKPVTGAGGGGAAPAPAKKPAARKALVKRKLAAPGESCVLDACYAIAGCRPDLDSEDGLFIPDALEVLGILGLITDFTPADLDSDLSRPGLVLGVDLPGPHAVLVTRDGWWSWGEPWDPADFPLAVIEEAWQVSW